MPQDDSVATQTWRVTPDMMCILDPEGRFVAVNPAWEKTLGWSAEELIGKPYLDFLHPDDIGRSMVAFEEVKRGNPVLRFENRYRGRSEGYRWFSWVAVPEDDRYYCTVRDVTDVKARDQTITDQREEAALREQFLAILGHDLRNPLSAVTSGIRILMREQPDERTQEVLGQMQASTWRMSELIKNMMDFARVRLGDGLGLQRTPEPKLREKMVELVREVEAAFTGVRIQLTADIRSTVRCDTPRVMQVLANLIVNAITHGTKEELIRVDARVVDGRLRMSVCNVGEAIPEDGLATLFQPFFKGGADSSPQGLGLGLYICWEIAAAHGGELKVASDQDETCFVFDVPA